MRTFCENANVGETDICRKVLSGGMDKNLQLLILIFYERTRVGDIWAWMNFVRIFLGSRMGELTAFHAEFTDLFVVRIFVELHGTGEHQGQSGKDTSRIGNRCM